MGWLGDEGVMQAVIDGTRAIAVNVGRGSVQTTSARGYHMPENQQEG